MTGLACNVRPGETGCTSTGGTEGFAAGDTISLRSEGVKDPGPVTVRWSATLTP